MLLCVLPPRLIACAAAGFLPCGASIITASKPTTSSPAAAAITIGSSDPRLGARTSSSSASSTGSSSVSGSGAAGRTRRTRTASLTTEPGSSAAGAAYSESLLIGPCAPGRPPRPRGALLLSPCCGLGDQQIIQFGDHLVL